MSVYKTKPLLNGEGGGGTTVVANPTLVGTEEDLTGLEVEGVKYKVPQDGQGGGTEFVEVTYGSTTTITQEQATALLNGAFIKAFNGIDSSKHIVMIPSSFNGDYCTGAEIVRGRAYVRHCVVDFDTLTIAWGDFELELYSSQL